MIKDRYAFMGRWYKAVETETSGKSCKGCAFEPQDPDAICYTHIYADRKQVSTVCGVHPVIFQKM